MLSIWKNEDFWAITLAFVVFTLVLSNKVSFFPKFFPWSNDLSINLNLNTITEFLVLEIFLLIITTTAMVIINNKKKLLEYITSFLFIFVLSYLSHLIAKQMFIASVGLVYAIWALFFGILIRNIFGIPKFLIETVKSGLFIKIGLVLLGAEIIFGEILEVGARGLFEVTIGLILVWYFCYYISRKLGLTKSFSAILANATSVCGVSAAIAAGIATKGDEKEISYVISIVILFAAPMMVLMPLLGKYFGIPSEIFGAWVGGTIDNTASVIATGALYSEQAMKIASVIKLSQNVLIGISAFILAFYWALKVENNPNEHRPRLVEIYYRFPKFIFGFLAASVFVSFIMVPFAGKEVVDGMLTITKGFRSWFFAIAFVCIGLNTNFKEVLKIGKGKPLLAFVLSTCFDLIISFITAYIFFGNIIILI